MDDSGTYVGSGNANAKWSSAVLQYDNRSNIIQKIDARGVITNYSYQTGGVDDPLNRIQSISYSPPSGIAAAPTVSYNYMTTGDQDRLSSVTAAGVSTDELSYDNEGRVTQQKRTLLTRSNYPLYTNYSYDTLSRVTSTQLPNQYGLAGSPRKLIENTFDTSSRLTSLKVNGAQQAGGIAYNAADQITSINIGVDGTNQVNEQYTFDPQTGLLTTQQAWRNGTKLLDLTYDYNRKGRGSSLRFCGFLTSDVAVS